ncbi:MAG: class I SAM-dependent methyltransferase [Undibacterium sp.]|nr:class I SAM-dependent methyltransferase [Opitutaceae bacterium]
MNSDEYLKLAEVEDRMWYFPSLHWHVQHAFRLAGIAADARVLDAGCGTGGLSLRLRAAHPGWRMEAIDFSPLAVELSRQRVQGVRFEKASITTLPFASGDFDAVVSADVICQVDDAKTALAEFFRVLKPGGLVVINVPAYMWMWSYHDDSCQTKHRYTRGELAESLRAAGFGEIKSTHWNALPFPLLVAKRKIFRSGKDTSDVKPYPAPLEAMFNGMMALEHAWVEAGGRWGWGSSIFVAARKPV